MVAGKDSQTAGVDRETVSEAVLHGEVGDQQILVAGLPEVHGRALHVGVEAFAGPIIDGHVAGIGGGAHERLLGQAAEHQDGIVA